MLSFFPTPYPDELLYSVFARYHSRSGNTSPKMTLKELFTSTSLSATVDLPSNLNALINNMPSCSTFTVDELIYSHTLYPFYSPFLPKEREELVLESMQSNFGGDIHTRTGIMASSIKTPSFLKFCPTCREDDMKNYGESYWHRLHQVPCVLVCPTHSQVLFYSNVQVHGLNKHEYNLVPECDYTNPCISEPSKESFEHLLFLSREVEWLLSQRLSQKELDWYRGKYLSKLIERGLATSIGSVNQNEMHVNFAGFYGEEFLNTVQSSVYPITDCDWLSGIVRKHRKAFHPIRHILIIRYLYGSLKNFYKNNCSIQPFGLGPWPCLNAAAEHYLKMVVNDIKISHCADTKRPVGTFSCSCGFIYSRRGPDENKEDQYRIGRVKSYGEVWENKLQELSNNNLSTREIARKLNVDSKTVKRYLCLSNSQAMVIEAKRKANSLKDVNRNKWKNLQEDNRNLSKTALRKLAPDVYAWLYRHDKSWLDENSPVVKRKKPNVNRVDWMQRDIEILEKVKRAVQEILLISEKPERISISRIGKRTDLLALLEKHLNKMPLTKEYLQSVTENTADFQLRRVEWAINELEKVGCEPQMWKVLRIAGIREHKSFKRNVIRDRLLN